MISRTVRFIRLGPTEKLLVCRAMLWVIFYRAGLWLLSPKWIEKWIRDDDRSGTGHRNGSDVREIVSCVKACSRYVPFASCLTQALAARTMLKTYGFPAVLRIGVAKSDGCFEAHAWLEVDGRIVLGKQRLHYRFRVLETSRSLSI